MLRFCIVLGSFGFSSMCLTFFEVCRQFLKTNISNISEILAMQARQPTCGSREQTENEGTSEEGRQFYSRQKKE